MNDFEGAKAIGQLGVYVNVWCELRQVAGAVITAFCI